MYFSFPADSIPHTFLYHLAMANDENIHKRRFEAAVKVMRRLPEDGTFEPSDDMLVTFYSYYKQATVGPCCTSKPNLWDSIGKAKWEAWKALGDMSKEQAMKEYVQEIQLILETMPVTEDVADLLDELEPFYEVVEDEDDEVTSEPPVLTIERNYPPEDAGDEESISFEEGKDGEDDVELESSSEDMTRPVVMKRADRESALVCNGSADTRSLHSSLNTDEEEDELDCSRENSLDSPDLLTCTDPTSDDVSEQKQQNEDSEGDVYTDSMENPASRKGSGVSRVQLALSMAVGAKRPEELGGSQDGKQQELCLRDPMAAGPVQAERASASKGRSGGGLVETHRICGAVGTNQISNKAVACVEEVSGVNKRSVNPQIVAALSRLQHDMQNVLLRLNTLEAQTAAQAETSPECDPLFSVKKQFYWWPLDVSPLTVALALVWPFAVHWLVQLYIQKKRRRIK